MTNGDVKSNPWVIFHKTRPPSFTSFDSQHWSTHRTTARSLIYKKKFSIYEKKSSICEKKSSIYEVLGSFARKLQIMDNWLIFKRDTKKRIEKDPFCSILSTNKVTSTDHEQLFTFNCQLSSVTTQPLSYLRSNS